MATRTLLLLAMAALLLFSNSVLCKDVSPSKDPLSKPTDDDDEDLSFLEEPDEAHGHHNLPDFDNFEGGAEDEDFGDFSDFEDAEGDGDEYKAPVVDEKDVVVLKEGNFSAFNSVAAAAYSGANAWQ